MIGSGIFIAPIGAAANMKSTFQIVSLVGYVFTQALVSGTVKTSQALVGHLGSNTEIEI